MRVMDVVTVHSSSVIAISCVILLFINFVTTHSQVCYRSNSVLFVLIFSSCYSLYLQSVIKLSCVLPCVCTCAAGRIFRVLLSPWHCRSVGGHFGRIM